jgi:hypothetical protein
VVRVLSVSGNVVTADLTALQTSGLAKHYRGTYTVSGGMIISSNILQVSS